MKIDGTYSSFLRFFSTLFVVTVHCLRMNLRDPHYDLLTTHYSLFMTYLTLQFKHEIKVVEEVEEEDQSQSTGTGTGVFGLFGSQSSAEPSKSTKKAVGV